MAYTTINKSTDHFNTVLYTGNASGNHAITGVNFRPDFLWIKPRSGTDSHRLHSPLFTGTDYFLTSNTTNAEAQNAGCVSSFDTDGFTLNNADSGWNANGTTYVSWNWKGAGSGSGSSNSDGSISSTVSANTTAGFSIVKYTGTGSNATVGHGLGSAPKFIIVKNYSRAGENWRVGILTGATDFTGSLQLDNTGAYGTASNIWNDTAPTSSVFSVGTAQSTNYSGDNLIAYCFAEKTGYSQFGSYTGNGNADGPFIYTGFKPAFLLAKESSSSGEGWIILDSVRNPGNLVKNSLQANITQAEETLTTKSADFLSNGFKIRTTDGLQNSNGETYIYMAFAEVPLVGTNNIPVLAR